MKRHAGPRAMIACLGWGSLVWDPRELPVKKPWCDDGPMAKIDFLRMSDNGRMTLVLDASAPWIQSLWVTMTVEDLRLAKIALARREGTYQENGPARRIDSWSRGDPTPALIEALPAWGEQRRVDHVIWTALPSRFNGADRTPSANEVVAYLRTLSGQRKTDAEEYVRKASPQVDTPVRRRIAEELGWNGLVAGPLVQSV